MIACRLTALDLIQRDFVSLSEEPHSFPVADELSDLLRQLYASAAAALAMLSEQISRKEQLTDACVANQAILKVWGRALCGAMLQTCCVVLHGAALCCAYSLRFTNAHVQCCPPVHTHTIITNFFDRHNTVGHNTRGLCYAAPKLGCLPTGAAAASGGHPVSLLC